MSAPIYCPFVGSVYDETRDALERHARPWGPVEYVNLGENNDLAYGQFLSDAWRNGAEFAIVEQDVVIHDGVVPGFANPHPWVAFPYEGQDTPNLGCMKIGQTLMRLAPTFADELQRTLWRDLDRTVQNFIPRLSFSCLVLEPHVRHLNPAYR